MRITGPWEIPLPPEDDQRRQEIKQKLAEQTYALGVNAEAQSDADLVESIKTLRRLEAIAVLSIPDRYGVISPLPQDPQLNLVHDPHGLDSVYVIIEQLKYEKATLLRQLNQGAITAQDYSQRHDQLVTEAKREVAQRNWNRGAHYADWTTGIDALTHPETRKHFEQRRSDSASDDRLKRSEEARDRTLDEAAQRRIEESSKLP